MAGAAEVQACRTAGRAVDQVPVGVGGAVDGRVGLAVAVKVGLRYDVAGGAQRDGVIAAVAASQDPPGAGRGTKDGQIGLAVAVIIARGRQIARCAPAYLEAL